MFWFIERMYFETVRFCDDLQKQRKENPSFLEGLFTDYKNLLKVIKPIYKRAEQLEKYPTPLYRELRDIKIKALHDQMEIDINQWVDKWVEKYKRR